MFVIRCDYLAVISPLNSVRRFGQLIETPEQLTTLINPAIVAYYGIASLAVHLHQNTLPVAVCPIFPRKKLGCFHASPNDLRINIRQQFHDIEVHRFAKSVLCYIPIRHKAKPHARAECAVFGAAVKGVSYVLPEFHDAKLLLIIRNFRISTTICVLPRSNPFAVRFYILVRFAPLKRKKRLSSRTAVPNNKKSIQNRNTKPNL